MMLPGVVKKLRECRRQLADIEAAMAAGDGDWQALGVAHGRLAPMVEAFGEWERADAVCREVADMEADGEDMRELVAVELASARAARAAAEEKIRRLVSPEAAEDRRSCFLEIRAAVGGNESCLFAADLWRMYARAAERHGWRVEQMSLAEGEVGGFREAIVKVAGEGAYGRLKFESGAHRVQRVPLTESQGRVHTSIVTVAVMAEANDVDDDVALSPADLRVETFRSSGAGGQHVNTTDSAVRITHLPTGIVAECQDDRSQHKNRDKALSVLKARIVNARRRERLEREASERRGLVGSGDRSDRIRTYNFPQGRMTDHRIGLTLYRLAAVMEGEIEEILDALAAADEEARAVE